MRSGVTRPRQVLELIGTEHPISADQPVGAGELSVQRRRVDQQQHEREARPGRQRHQQHDLDRARLAALCQAWRARLTGAGGRRPGGPRRRPEGGLQPAVT